MENKQPTGLMTANFYPDSFLEFSGGTYVFFSQNSRITYIAVQRLGPNTYNYIAWDFPQSIANGKNFFKDGVLKAPDFATVKKDHATIYHSLPDEGYVDMKFDLESGTLSAELNFTLEGRIQVVATIDEASGLLRGLRMPNID